MEKQSQPNAIAQTIGSIKKKAYCPPVLSEYGDIVKVTQSMMAGSVADMAGKLMMNMGDD